MRHRTHSWSSLRFLVHDAKGRVYRFGQAGNSRIHQYSTAKHDFKAPCHRREPRHSRRSSAPYVPPWPVCQASMSPVMSWVAAPTPSTALSTPGFWAVGRPLCSPSLFLGRGRFVLGSHTFAGTTKKSPFSRSDREPPSALRSYRPTHQIVQPGLSQITFPSRDGFSASGCGERVSLQRPYCHLENQAPQELVGIVAPQNRPAFSGKFGTPARKRRKCVFSRALLHFRRFLLWNQEYGESCKKPMLTGVKTPWRSRAPRSSS